MEACDIHITGIVQGVGFRPFVYRLAEGYGITGWVRNSSDGVHIHAESNSKSLPSFINKVKNEPPELAFISNVDVSVCSPQGFNRFEIIKSLDHRERTVLLTPDYALCPECEKELFDPNNRRYRYPFTTCTLCGPRFSITQTIPFDRSNTVMDEVPMCKTCQKEYHEVFDRRYYAQTNSCEVCGFELQLYNEDGEQISDARLSDSILNRVLQELTQGQIIAVKGIGGYLLICDATNELAVSNLRSRKRRPQKPFALIYPDLKMLTRDFIVSDKELNEYLSVQAPIILFRKRESQPSDVACEALAPGLDHLGVMRPYAPLLALISRDFNKPLVATSGNVSGSSIIYQDDQAKCILTSIADMVVSHNRDILIPQDDSVVKFTDQGQRIMIRRSRGHAPNYLKSVPISTNSALALGSSMKGSFCLQHEQNIYISQYLGDLEFYDAQLSYEHTLNHLSKTLDFEPKIILNDKHPGYFTTQLGKDLSKFYDTPRYSIQHHEAHFAAVLAENNLLSINDPVLGIIWDGTGYGHDGQVWGGEFMEYSENSFQRIAHLRYYAHVLGDKMPREPRLSALSILSESEFLDRILKKFSTAEAIFYLNQLEASDLKTSSMGRLFDAAACILGLIDRNTYEGQSAMLLEALGSRGKKNDCSDMFFTGAWLSPASHLEQLIIDLNRGLNKENAAWNFHYRLVSIIRYVADAHYVDHLAFSGGVFQNGLLVDMVKQQLEQDYNLYFHELLSPNDESISLGQLMRHEIANRRLADLKQTSFADAL